MIDPDGYRPGVAMVVTNHRNQVLIARRIGRRIWQVPQGGIDHHESPEEALYREMKEEIGLEPDAVEILERTSTWLRYNIPRRYIRRNQHPVCIGQKQRWFLLRLLADDSAIRVDAHPQPEFDQWRWVDYWEPARRVIYFKGFVYRRALAEFAPVLGVEGSGVD